MVVMLVAGLCLTSAQPLAAEPGARDSFHAGVQAFAVSNYPAAGQSFLAAADAAPAEKLDPAAAHYNAGLAAYAGGDIEKASTHFANAAAGSDLALQSKAYYNRGNVLFQLADQPPTPPGHAPAPDAGSDLDLSESAIGEALQMYENAIALDPRDVDAKANYELAVLKQQQIQQQKQEPQKQDEPKQDPKQEEKNDQQNQEKQPNEQPKPQPEQQPQPQQDEQQKEQEQPIQDEKPSEEMTPEEAADDAGRNEGPGAISARSASSLLRASRAGGKRLVEERLPARV